MKNGRRGRVEKAHEIQLQLKLNNVMAISREAAVSWGDCSSDISVLNRVTRHKVEIPNIQLNI